MRHHNNVRKFGRTKNQRRALLKGLALSLIKTERITTTEAKAKELRPYIEKMISQAQKGDANSKRLIVAKLMNRVTESKKLIEDIAPRFKGRQGGYTRILKLPQRLSDGAPMAIIEFVA
jgi:large subunit ribosomal protein L17